MLNPLNQVQGQHDNIGEYLQRYYRRCLDY